MTTQSKDSEHISIGRLGERIAKKFLENRGFNVIEQNYRKKWGELDIIAKKDNALHFVEVKAGSWNKERWPKDGEERYRPEDHMHKNKCDRLGRAVRTYLLEKKIPKKSEWTVDLVVVLINKKTKKVQVKVVHNILLG